MKILEIGGCDIASLKGEFRIRLDKPPFASEGLFAIRGPTGSGKSSLIDAICLALYDDTPRFVGRGGPKVGPAGQDAKERLSATDPRSLLRRGAARAWAEVVFEGKDRGPWRAKWSVSRARRRVEGRLQDQEMELENMATGRRVAGNKSEVLKAVREQVGLDFEQFRRSALLAQGEFAAFAKADAEERAALLEAMTGTAVYAALSIAAHKKSALEAQALAEMNREREALGLLEPMGREALEAKARDLESRIAEGEAKALRLRGELAWYARLSELEGLAAQAQDAADAAQAAWTGAADRHLRLRRLEEAQGLRPLRERLTRAEARHAGLAENAARRAAQMPAIEEACVRGTEALERAEKALDDVRAAAQAAKPDLDAARALDTRLGECARRLGAATEESAARAGEARAADEGRNASVAEEDRLGLAAAELDRALEALSPIRELLPVLARVDADIASYAEEGRALAGFRLALAQARAAAEEERSSIASITAKREEGAAAAAARRADLDALESAIAGEPREALNEARRGSQERLDAAREALAVLGRLRPAILRREAALREVAELREAAAQGAAEMEEAARGLEGATAALGAARAASDKARGASDLEELRHRLVAGEACPLCGALEHPWAEGSPLPGLLDSLLAQVRELEEGQRGLEARRAAAEERKSQAALAEAKARDASSANAIEIELEERAYASLMPAFEGLPEDAREPGAQGSIRRRIAELEAALASLDLREKALRERESRAEIERRELRETEEGLREFEAEAARLGELLHGREMEERGLGAELGGRDERLAALRASLEAQLVALPEALALLEEDPETLRRGLSAKAQACREALSSRAALDARIVEAARATAAIGATAAEREAVAAEAARKLRAVHEELGELRSLRLRYFEGRSVAELEAEAGERDRAAKAALDAAALARQEAVKARVEAAGALAILSEELAKAEAEASEASGSVAAARDALGWTEEEAALLLAWDEKAIQAERLELLSIEDEAKAAKAILDERRAEAERQAQSPRPELSLTEAQVAESALKAALDELKSGLGALRAELCRDDEAALRAASLAGRITEQEGRARLWGEMDELIGSSDGKKLRLFAQSLSLEALVAYANDHLSRLGPRYALQRVPGYDLELQVVDRDMGDEVRALNGLSGGETFLVSLALALGLSSLSASETPIDSLFIDEGFGTLDAETLESALSVLDELRSQGRQVGIISHVEGLDAHIPVQIRVERLGGGASRLVLPG